MQAAIDVVSCSCKIGVLKLAREEAKSLNDDDMQVVIVPQAHFPQAGIQSHIDHAAQSVNVATD